MLKVMEFDSVEAYEASNASSKYEVVAIVKRGNKVCADLITSCKRYQTALRRFFKALEGHDEFNDWQEPIEGACADGTFQDTSVVDGQYIDGYHWCVEACGDDCYYIELTVCNDDDAADVDAEPVAAPSLFDGVTADPLTEGEKTAILDRWERLATEFSLPCRVNEKAYFVWKFFERLLEDECNDQYSTDELGTMAPYLFGFDANFEMGDHFHVSTTLGWDICVSTTYGVKLFDRWMMNRLPDALADETFQDIYTKLVDADNRKNKIRTRKNPLADPAFNPLTYVDAAVYQLTLDDAATEPAQIDQTTTEPVQEDQSDADLVQANESSAKPTQTKQSAADSSQTNSVPAPAKLLDDCYTLVAVIALPMIEPSEEKWKPP